MRQNDRLIRAGLNEGRRKMEEGRVLLPPYTLMEEGRRKREEYCYRIDGRRKKEEGRVLGINRDCRCHQTYIR